MIRTHGDNCKEPCEAEYAHNVGILEAELKKLKKENDELRRKVWDQWGYRTVCVGGTHWTEFSKAPKKGDQLGLWKEPSERWMSGTCESNCTDNKAH